MEHGYNLQIGKSLNTVDDEGAQPRQCADVGQHGSHHVSAAVIEIFIAGSKREFGDESGKDAGEYAEDRQP